MFIFIIMFNILINLKVFNINKLIELKILNFYKTFYKLLNICLKLIHELYYY